MSKISQIMLAGGLALIIITYVLLYTPVYNMFWGYKPPKEYQGNIDFSKTPIPKVPAISKPLSLEAAAKPIATKEAAAKKPAAKKAASIEVVAQVKKKEELKIEIPKFVTLRDPFALDFSYQRVEAPPTAKPTAAAPAPAKASLVLQGIFLSGKMKSAIIDDKLVYVGTKVAGGWKVYDIKSDMVTLVQSGKYKFLRISQGVL